MRFFFVFYLLFPLFRNILTDYFFRGVQTIQFGGFFRRRKVLGEEAGHKESVFTVG